MNINKLPIKKLLLSLAVFLFLLAINRNYTYADHAECNTPGQCGGDCFANEICEPGTHICQTAGPGDCPPACIPWGGACGSSNSQWPSVPCCPVNSPANCTADNFGTFRCGDTFNDNPAQRPDAYSGPIIDLPSLLKNAFNLVLPAAIAFLGVPIAAVGGYKIMTSQGDPARVKEGKEALTAAVIGILFLLLSLSLLRIILSNFLGN